jgi:hypothetical protein
MKTHPLVVAVLGLFSTVLQAQTKRIAFESHSGNPGNFNIALANELFDNDNSDFGLPVPKDVKTYKLDSVIFVSDTLSVVVKKEYSRPYSEPKGPGKFIRTVKDTVYNDPLFAKKHSLDSIKTVLNTNGQYVKKVVFIGYDNKKPEDKKQNILPLAITDDPPTNDPPFDMQLALMLGTLLLLSLLGGWLSWRFYQPRLQQRRA